MKTQVEKVIETINDLSNMELLTEMSYISTYINVARKIDEKQEVSNTDKKALNSFMLAYNKDTNEDTV